MTDLSKLSDRELDARVTKLRGWRIEERWCGTEMDHRLRLVWVESKPWAEIIHEYAPPYSTDANAARELEAEIRTRGFQQAYIHTLDSIAGSVEWDCQKYCTAWGYATATPRQRAEAFVIAMEAR